jgi:ferric-dicitrate binding protein FerR (iron transport regulator)
VRHEQAWKLLPDLLDDRDDPELLAHVRECADCQRQVFLLGRVDRFLRDAASDRQTTLGPRRRTRRLLLVAATVAAAAAAALLTPFASHHPGGHRMMLRTASGQLVAEALMGHSDARNVSLDLTARGLPVDRGDMFVLWAGDNGGPPTQVGRFMVDRTGSCRVRFNLPATRAWEKLWVAWPGKPESVVAST